MCDFPETRIIQTAWRVIIIIIIIDSVVVSYVTFLLGGNCIFVCWWGPVSYFLQPISGGTSNRVMPMEVDKRQGSAYGYQHRVVYTLCWFVWWWLWFCFAPPILGEIMNLVCLALQVALDQVMLLALEFGCNLNRQMIGIWTGMILVLGRM